MKSTRKIVFLALLIASGILLQLIESFVPIVLFVPGFKIGFANIATLLALMLWGVSCMWIVSLVRIFMAALLMGTLFSVSFWLSLSGGLLSLIFMSLAYKSKVFSVYGISIMGAGWHSVGQVLMVTYIYQQFFMQLFLPVLLALSIVSGLCIAMIENQVFDRIKKGMSQYGKI